MKYIELKSSLKTGIENAYLIFGDDRYLCFDALKKIEERASISIKDMNSVILSGDSATMKEIVDSCNVYPFGDEFRLVIVRGLSAQKKEELKVLEEYLMHPLSSTILVFQSPEKPENISGMPHIVPIDCNKIDPKTISDFVKNALAKAEVSSNEEAINKLILFCGQDMARVTNELEKLIAYTADTKVLDSALVEEFVVQDREYQVFELAEFIAKGDATNAIKLVDSFMVKAGGGLQVLGPLYNNYRRALYVSINKDKTLSEIANLLSVKEFAVKMLNNQVKIFSSKKLKQIVDMIAKYERKIKVGEIKENIAIKTIVFNILNLRGNNE